MNAPAGPENSGNARLARIESLLASDPAQAESEAGRLLQEDPQHAMARLFLGIARRLTGNPAAAIEVLAPLAESVPGAPLPHLQLGLAWREAGDRENAVASMRRAVAVKPDFSDAWLALADTLKTMGAHEEADRAFVRYIEHSASDPRLRVPMDALRDKRDADAETYLRTHLKRHPNDVRALCMLAEVALRHERYEDAESLLKGCLELAPSYRTARHNYAVVLMRLERPLDVLREVDRLLESEPADLNLQNLKAATFQRLGDYDQALKTYESILETHPDDPGVWSGLGHTLRTLGRLAPSVEAYRKATALAPEFGEAWWNLANLKTFRFDEADLERMRGQLAKPGLNTASRISFNFAIGKALEDQGEFGRSFEHYAEGNRLRRQGSDYNAGELTAQVRRCKRFFTAPFFASRTGYGEPSSEPIFIVGLPRSGSTLVEQILASHSQVEGTMELPHIADIARPLAARAAAEGEEFPQVLAKLGKSETRDLGRSYLERARVQRRLDLPMFIDKMPNNFGHVGLIHLILPNARIIDVRRDPMACGLSIFKHLFAQGQLFSYSLEDIGHCYREYADLMAHFDEVLPGRVHRVAYESLVEDTEGEVRRLLDYCRLPFEAACLKYYENKRAVATPSSQQVRAPIFRDALEHWRHFEPWLDPLRTALAPKAHAGERPPGD
ncbi:MAG TPA: sulfotransferase [Woeseiaceae bacterium]|nr:sulfotransferase [Woeseiaceae bacterium]